MVREYKGPIPASTATDWCDRNGSRRMYGRRIARAFAEIKQAFDPKNLMNPGKIVAPTKMDDRSLFRYKPGYQAELIDTGFDWSEHETGERDAGRGFAAAVEMCNNNGHCRKFDAGTMCPSLPATRNERI